MKKVFTLIEFVIPFIVMVVIILICYFEQVRLINVGCDNAISDSISRHDAKFNNDIKIKSDSLNDIKFKADALSIKVFLLEKSNNTLRETIQLKEELLIKMDKYNLLHYEVRGY